MIHFEPSAREEMIADSVKTYPDECCGFLLGKDSTEGRLVRSILMVNNAKKGDRHQRFEISPEDYMAAEKYAENNKLELLGVYHSHPDHPAVPSEMDLLAAQPYFSYVILSVVNGEFAGARSWRLNDAIQFEEERIGQFIIIH